MGYDKSKLSDILGKILENAAPGGSDAPGADRLILAGAGASIHVGDPNNPILAGVVPSEAGPGVVVSSKGVHAISAFCDECLKDQELRSTVGRSAVLERIHDILREKMKGVDVTPTADFVRYQILQPLRSAVKHWEVFVPVINLEVERTIEFGEFTYLHRNVAEKAVTAPLGQHRYPGTAAESDAQKMNVASGLVRILGDSTCWMKFRVQAHIKLIPEVCPAKAAYGVNFLRCFCRILFGGKRGAIFGVPNDVQTFRWSYLYYDTDPHTSINSHNTVGGGWLPCRIDSSAITYLTDNWHFGEIDLVLRKPEKERNEVEGALVQAMQSWGKSFTGFTNEDRLLSLVIGLERLLVCDGEQSTTERLSDRLALHIGADANDKRDISREAKRLYDLRSKIVHSAWTGIDEKDVTLAHNWLASAFLVLVENLAKFKSHREFCSCLDSRKFS